MLINTCIAFAVKCDICGRIEVHNISLFDFSKDRAIKLECTCGHSNAIIKTRDFKSFWFEIPCYECQDTHVFKYTLKQIMKGNVVTRCIETGAEISFIGDEKDVKEIVDKFERESQDLLTELGFNDYFINSDVMLACINKIHELDHDGRILCECGSGIIETDIYEDRIELRCFKCDSIQVIYAETEEDLENLLSRDSIIMHKHKFQCIDAINQNSDMKKKRR